MRTVLGAAGNVLAPCAGPKGPAKPAGRGPRSWPVSQTWCGTTSLQRSQTMAVEPEPISPPPILVPDVAHGRPTVFVIRTRGRGLGRNIGPAVRILAAFW
jgi:hypothetical protein